MLNKYPLWKNLVIVFALVIGFIYALPNFFPDDYAIQITGARGSTEVEQRVLDRALAKLEQEGIEVKSSLLEERDALIRLTSSDDQLRARPPAVQAALGNEYLVALNMAPSTPGWLRSLGAGPMKLGGLDLRGGVHFLLEVDMETALNQRLEALSGQIKRELREERIRYRGGDIEDQARIVLSFRDEAARSEAFELVRDQYNEFLLDETTEGEEFLLTLTLSEAEVRNIQEYALEQNLTTIRNRVNELGVAEPLVQRQGGADRIIVELPGVQDTAQAKRVLGATANLEFRMEARQDAPSAETEQFPFRDNSQRTARLERDVIATGNNVANAQQAFDENGQPQVNITMDSVGGDLMNRATRNSIGRRMAVLFIEYRTETETREVNGEIVETENRVVEKGIISLATVQSALGGSSFRITGLDSIPPEAAELALLLSRCSGCAHVLCAGAHHRAKPGGAEEYRCGMMSVMLGFGLVLLYMLVFYRGFGLVANVALTLNLMLLVACMSILSATLTLPGIAGIVLTVGMAVDANVLIFERIKEELKAGGVPPQSAINAGYGRAFVSIFDANITTLLVAVILFAMGSGPVKGFAVTLCIGILTSMFSGLMVSRGIVNLVYGGRRVEKLSIGGGSLKMPDMEKQPFDFMGLRKIASVLSIVLVVASIALLGGVRGLNLGMDFTGGGTSVELEYAEAPSLDGIRNTLTEAGGYEQFAVQNFGADTTVLIRMAEAGNDELALEVAGVLAADGADLELVSSEFVGSQVGEELKEDSGLGGLLIALAVVLIYVGMRFQFKFGIASVIPLAHDVIIVLGGVFALFQWTFDLTVLAALLAVIGYSLNDTIVVADRIRENFRKMRVGEAWDIINQSIHETITRTINTSGTTLVVLLALYFLGGEAINNFALALIIGVVVGTYSSIYVSANMLMVMGVTREDLMVPAKEGTGEEEEEQPPEWLNRM